MEPPSSFLPDHATQRYSTAQIVTDTYAECFIQLIRSVANEKRNITCDNPDLELSGHTVRDFVSRFGILDKKRVVEISSGTKLIDHAIISFV